MKISQRSAELPASGIRKMFELSAKFNDVINLCIGEPDFETLIILIVPKKML